MECNFKKTILKRSQRFFIVPFHSLWFVCSNHRHFLLLFYIRSQKFHNDFLLKNKKGKKKRKENFQNFSMELSLFSFWIVPWPLKEQAKETVAMRSIEQKNFTCSSAVKRISFCLASLLWLWFDLMFVSRNESPTNSHNSDFSHSTEINFTCFSTLNKGTNIDFLIDKNRSQCHRTISIEFLSIYDEIFFKQKQSTSKFDSLNREEKNQKNLLSIDFSDRFSAMKNHHLKFVLDQIRHQWNNAFLSLWMIKMSFKFSFEWIE